MNEIEKPQEVEKTPRERINEIIEGYCKRYNNLIYTILNGGESLVVKNFLELKELTTDDQKKAEYDRKIRSHEELSKDIKFAISGANLSDEEIERYKVIATGKSVNEDDVQFVRDFFLKIATVYDILTGHNDANIKHQHLELWQ